MLRRLRFFLECSRYYTLPMSFFSWLTVFVFSLKSGGNVFYGVLALVGIMFAHLATNLFDDICDYPKLTKIYEGKVTLPNTQRGKCAYFINGLMSRKQAVILFFSYCFTASLIGLFFVLKVGIPVIFLMGAGALTVLLYSLLSYHSMSEIAVGFAFGPLLFLGTYYVMTGKFSYLPLILSVPSMLFTVNLLYTDTFMDKDIDKNEGKRTLVNAMGKYQLLFQKLILFLGYVTALMLPVFGISDIKIVLILFTLPLAKDLTQSLALYLKNPKALPQKRWYHFPFEYWEDIMKNRSPVFMFRMYQARNLMIYNSLILALSVL